MSECFCGCGRDVTGLRKSAVNKIGRQVRKDVALFRGGIEDRLVDPGDVGEVQALADEAERRLEVFAAYLHGHAGRADLDKKGVRAWLSRAADHRKDISVAVTGMGFHGGGLHLPELVYGGRRDPGVITQLHDTGTTVNEQPRARVTIEVHPADGAPFQTTTKMLLTRVDPPRVGDDVEVAWDPDDPSDFAFRRSVDR